MYNTQDNTVFRPVRNGTLKNAIMNRVTILALSKRLENKCIVSRNGTFQMPPVPLF